MPGMEEFESSFVALDPDENEVGINVYRTMVTIPQHGGDIVKPGRAQLETDDGQAVNPLSDGKYEIVESGIILTSDHPDRYNPQSIE